MVLITAARHEGTIRVGGGRQIPEEARLIAAVLDLDTPFDRNTA